MNFMNLFETVKNLNGVGSTLEKAKATIDYNTICQKLSWHYSKLETINKEIIKLEIEMEYEGESEEIQTKLKNLYKSKEYSTRRVPELRKARENLKSKGIF